MALRLGPGGKALMVLAGLALIGLGLWYAGLIPLGTPTADVVEPERGEAGEAPIAAAPVPEESPPRDDPPPTPAAPDPVPPVPPVPPAGSRAATLMPPPLFAASEARLRVSKMVDPGGAAELLRGLTTGTTDIIEIDLHDLIEFAVPARSALVIGARPPSRLLFLCAEEDPIESLRPGSRVGVGRSAHRLPAAHVAEAKGVEATSLSWVGSAASPTGSPAADVSILDREREDLACVSLFEIGAQGPTLLLARGHDARVYSRSYLAAADSLGGRDAFGRRYLEAAIDDPSGYAWHAGYASQLFARLRGSSPAAPPEAAGWIIGGATR